MSSVSLFFHTIRYLRPSQILGRLWFKLYSPSIKPIAAPELRPAMRTLYPVCLSQQSILGADRFIFLNLEGSLSDARSWNDSGKDKLWLYNLHYFDDLNAEAANDRVDWHRGLIQRWIEENPPAIGNGWESYPLSLRIVNWIKWSVRGNDMEHNWLDSLATQARYLRKRLEYHLLGNHLFANAKALVFAGLFFSGNEAKEWLVKGLAVLRHELSEQVLGDGGHFERSPMYHAIILEDVLDLINILRVYEAEPALQGQLAENATKMLGWLNTMCHPDGEFGFFNDTALGVAPTLSDLGDYAERLGLAREKAASDDLVHLGPSGYIRVQQDELVALLDVGEIGPDYLPGHAHADTLSFELSLFDQRLIVNSGISCYGVSEERLRQRSTTSHTTVEINGENSSEVWSGFRVARRARPSGLKVSGTENRIYVSCAHDGYTRLQGSPIHQRTWKFGGGRLEVCDIIERKFNRAVARYYFHPDVKVLYIPGDLQGELELRTGQMVEWSVTGGEVSVEKAGWHPGFGLSVPNQCVSVEFAENDILFRLQWQAP